jgi:hypothetical protein
MRFQLFGLALLSFATVADAAPCASEPRTSAGVIATEHAWVAALEHRDGSALDCILGSGFSENNWHGKQVSRAEVLAHLAERPSSKLHLSELSTTVDGSMAVARGINTQTGPDGKVTGSVRFTDVFLYSDHRWRAIAAQETLVSH